MFVCVGVPRVGVHRSELFNAHLSVIWFQQWFPGSSEPEIRGQIMNSIICPGKL